jgi:hypothetical protein
MSVNYLRLYGLIYYLYPSVKLIETLIAYPLIPPPTHTFTSISISITKSLMAASGVANHGSHEFVPTHQAVSSIKGGDASL